MTLFKVAPTPPPEQKEGSGQAERGKEQDDDRQAGQQEPADGHLPRRRLHRGVPDGLLRRRPQPAAPPQPTTQSGGLSEEEEKPPASQGPKVALQEAPLERRFQRGESRLLSEMYILPPFDKISYEFWILRLALLTMTIYYWLSTYVNFQICQNVCWSDQEFVCRLAGTTGSWLLPTTTRISATASARSPWPTIWTPPTTPSSRPWSTVSTRVPCRAPVASQRSCLPSPCSTWTSTKKSSWKTMKTWSSRDAGAGDHFFPKKSVHPHKKLRPRRDRRESRLEKLESLGISRVSVSISWNGFPES